MYARFYLLMTQVMCHPLAGQLFDKLDDVVNLLIH